MARRDLINVGSQIALKVISIPTSLVMTGLAVRTFDADQNYLILSAANYLSMLGLLQAGLGAYVSRRVSNEFGRTGVLGDMPDIRGAFALMAAAGSVAGLWTVFSGVAPPAVIPSALLLLAALSLGLADNVRLATGEAAKSNFFMLGSYAICISLMAIALLHKAPILALAIFAISAPQYVANLMSFAALLRKPAFRALVSPGPVQLWRPLRDAAPLFMFSLGTAGLLNAPIAGQILHGFPKISLESLACLRLFSNGQNVYYFVLLPLMPIVLRERHARSEADFSRFVTRMIGALLAVNVLGGFVFWLAGPPFVKLWLGKLTVAPALAAQWGVIAALWLGIVTAAYFFQVLFRAYRGVACLALAVAATLAAPYVSPGIGVEQALIAGLLCGHGLALAFALHARTESPRPGLVASSA